MLLRFVGKVTKNLPGGRRHRHRRPPRGGLGRRGDLLHDHQLRALQLLQPLDHRQRRSGNVSRRTTPRRVQDTGHAWLRARPIPWSKIGRLSPWILSSYGPGHALRDAAARRRLAPRHRRGRRRRDVRAEVSRRRPGRARAHRRARVGGDCPRARAARARVVFADLDPELARTEPDPEIHALIGQRRAEPGARLPAGIGHLRPDRAEAGRGPRVAHRLVRRLCDQRRPHRPQHEHADVAPPAVAHRSWRDALFPSRAGLGDGGGAGARSVPLIRNHVLLGAGRHVEAVDEDMAAGSPGSDRGDRQLDAGELAGRRAGSDAAARAPRTRAISRSGSPRRGRSSRRPGVAGELTYDYAIVRIVPRVERGERINVGVILSCVDVVFLDARIELDMARLLALDPELISRRSAPVPRPSRWSAPAARAGAIGALAPRDASAGWSRRAARSSRCRRSTPAEPRSRRGPRAAARHHGQARAWRAVPSSRPCS